MVCLWLHNYCNVCRPYNNSFSALNVENPLVSRSLQQFIYFNLTQGVLRDLILCF